jgi:XRE family transcriptional regulator|nr:MAG TPA: helix-turn-helix domain protein [Caudoviricetes sp.]
MKKKESIATFGDRLKEALKVNNMTQSKLSEISGINTSTISEYIKGKYDPSRSRIFEFSEILKVNPVWLMGFDVPMKEEKLEKEPEIPEVDTSVLTAEELAEFEKVTQTNKLLFFNGIEDDDHDMAVFKNLIIDILLKQRKNKEKE